VIHAVDADRVVADQAVGLCHDRLADALHVLDAVQPGRQLLDRAEACRTLADRAEQPGVRHGSRHAAGKRRAQLQLVARPVVRRPVVEDEEADRLVPEHERDEVDRPEPQANVDLRKSGRRLRAGEDERPALRDRPHPGRVVALVQRGDGIDQLGVEVPVGGKAQRVAAGVHQPERCDVRPEQRLGGVEDVLEYLGQLKVGADLRHDPAQRNGPGLVGPGTGRA